MTKTKANPTDEQGLDGNSGSRASTEPYGLGPTGFDPGRCESRCDDCHGTNPVWFAPNALWNLVIGGPEAKGDPGGFICPVCFIARAEAGGMRPTAWELRPEHDV
jgi:hypothetical protein